MSQYMILLHIIILLHDIIDLNVTLTMHVQTYSLKQLQFPASFGLLIDFEIIVLFCTLHVKVAFYRYTRQIYLLNTHCKSLKFLNNWDGMTTLFYFIRSSNGHSNIVHSNNCISLLYGWL